MKAKDIQVGDDILLYNSVTPAKVIAVMESRPGMVALIINDDGRALGYTVSLMAIKKVPPAPPKFKVGDMAKSSDTGRSYLITGQTSTGYSAKRVDDEAYNFSRDVFERACYKIS